MAEPVPPVAPSRAYVAITGAERKEVADTPYRQRNSGRCYCADFASLLRLGGERWD